MTKVSKHKIIFEMSCGCRITQEGIKPMNINGKTKNVCKIHPTGIKIKRFSICSECGKEFETNLEYKSIPSRCSKKCEKIAGRRASRKAYYKKKKEKIVLGIIPKPKIVKKINVRGCYCKESCIDGDCKTCDKFVPLFANYDPLRIQLVRR